jgi:NTE family protein
MTRPPRLALVLGSGGVRSAAAIGIVEVLQSAGLRPDLIVGCSSGAVFGAALASGMTPWQAQDASTRLWSRELTERTRWRGWLELALPRWAGFGPDFALRDAGRIALRLHEAFGSKRIEELPLPLRVVTTDATTGTPKVLARGPLVEALRASIAVPLLFPSVEVEGRRQVDGVLSDPLPLAAASDARVVLALGFEGAMPRRVDRVSRLVAQTTTALINNLQAARSAAAHAQAERNGQAIVAIEPRFEPRVGLWETEALPRVVEAGRVAAREQLESIRALLSAGSDQGDGSLGGLGCRRAMQCASM